MLPWLANPFRRLTVGLSLEGTTLRVLGCKGRHVEFWLSVPFEGTWLDQGFVGDPLAMGRLIGTAFRNRHLPTSRVICALPGYGAMARSLAIPYVDGHLHSVVEREARRVLGISLEENYLFWQSVGERAGRQQLYALAVPRQPLELMVETLQQAGIPPFQMDLKPLALARAVSQPDAVVVNAESNSIDLVVLREEVPLLMRSLFLEESNPEQVTQRLEAELAQALDELGKAAPKARLYLTGELAATEGLSGRLEAHSGLRAAPVPPLLGAPLDFPLARFAVNVGLVLKEA